MDGEFRTEFVRESSALKQHPALVLNADYRPLSYYPLSLWCWQDAVKAAYMDRVDIVAEYDHYVAAQTAAHARVERKIMRRNHHLPFAQIGHKRIDQLETIGCRHTLQGRFLTLSKSLLKDFSSRLRCKYCRRVERVALLIIFPWEPSTVLITGSNRGLGLKFAELYSLKNYNVIATCRDPDNARR